MKRLLSFIPVAVVALVLARPLSAQDRTGTWEITGFGGGYFGGTLYAGSTAIFNQDVQVGTAPTYGARLGYNFNRSFELEVGWSQAKPDITGPGSDLLFGQTVKLGTLTSNVVEGNFIFNITRGRIVPYLTLGAGAMIFSPEVAGYSGSSDTRFVGNFGGGVKMWVTPKLAFRIDGRYRSAYISSGDNYYYDTGGCNHGCYYYYGSNWYGSGEVTGGLTFAFGK
jgi:hypothetical protein